MAKVVAKVKQNSIVDLMMQCTEIESAKGNSKTKKAKKEPVVETQAPVEQAEPVKRKRRTKAEMALAKAAEVPVVEVEVPTEPVKRKRRTKAEMALAKAAEVIVPEVIVPEVIEFEVPTEPVKRKRRTKAEMSLVNAPVVQPVAVVSPVMDDEQKKEIVKYVIGYADAYRISQFKNMETHTQLTKEQFIESAKQIYRETPDVKYIYVECFYLDNECRTEVIFKDPRKELFTLNRLWSE